VPTGAITTGPRVRKGRGYLAEAGAVRKALLAALFAAAVPPGPAGAQDVTLQDHRATYELRLEGRADSSSIERAYGLLVIEMADACDSWNVRQGLVLTVARDGSEVTTTSDFESHEGKDGGWYRFEDRTRIGPDGMELSSGQASASPDTTGRTHVNEPVTDEALLPAGTLFPTAHLVSVLRGAMAGKRLMTDIVYDGTEGTRIYDVTTLIGRAGVDEASGKRVWPMSLAFFIHGDSAETPDLELFVWLREDGVATALRYDYGGFVLGAVLQSLETLPPPDC